MTKRMQIPVTAAEAREFKAAARRAGLPLSEWVRGLLRRAAEEGAPGRRMSPAEALERLFSLEGPIADVQTMIQESRRGRYE